MELPKLIFLRKSLRMNGSSPVGTTASALTQNTLTGFSSSFSGFITGMNIQARVLDWLSVNASWNGTAGVSGLSPNPILARLSFLLCRKGTTENGHNETKQH